MLVFGGLQGLEASLESDESLTVDDVSLLFHFYLNTCPNQGSRTIRTEVRTFPYLVWLLRSISLGSHFSNTKCPQTIDRKIRFSNYIIIWLHLVFHNRISYGNLVTSVNFQCYILKTSRKEATIMYIQYAIQYEYMKFNIV